MATDTQVRSTELSSTDDTEVRAQVLGSGDPEAQEAARTDVIERVGEDAYNANPERYWTAQQGGLPDTGRIAALGPQRYLKEQLPNPDIAKAGNITPQRIPEGLTIGEDEIMDGHPKGPEPGEFIRLAYGQAVDRHLMRDADEARSDANYLTLTSDGMAEIRRAQEGERGSSTEIEGDGVPEGEGDGSEPGEGDEQRRAQRQGEEPPPQG